MADDNKLNMPYHATNTMTGSLRRIATAATAGKAASAPDLVIIAVPEKAVPDLPRNVLAASSAVVVDTGNYYPSRDGRIAEIEEGLTDSEWVARST